MPIHDQGYRRYLGTRVARGRTWAVITKAGIRTMLEKRAFLALLLLAWLPFVVRTVQIYAAANFPQMAFIAPTVDTFRQFLDQQDVFVFFVTVYVGAGLIANDRRANALQIYLSKPLTRAEYVFGKLAILMAFLLMVTWLPAIVLLLVQVSFAGSSSPTTCICFQPSRCSRSPRRPLSPPQCSHCRRCRTAAASSPFCTRHSFSSATRCTAC
jgi:ABC-2 type transport system permease protein